MWRGAPTRRASGKVGSNIPPKAEQKKNAKILKNFYNLNGATGGLSQKLLSTVRLRH
jgi:hypothetical protein